MTRIAVIGAGRIGEALVSGLLVAGHQARDLVFAEKNPVRAEELHELLGVRASSTIADAIEGADVVVVAVKPADVERVMADVGATEDSTDRLVVSLVAGIPTGTFEHALSAGAPVVRVMPNTPMLVGKGISAIAAGRYAHDEHLDIVESLLGAVGSVVRCQEKDMDAVTAVSGSGPAYFFLVVEALVDGAVAAGLSRDLALTLVTGTIYGSAAMLMHSDQSATDLRAAVTSPGGTTAAAVSELERRAVRSAFIDAVAAAKERSELLGMTNE